MSQSNYSRYIDSSSENICGTTIGAQEKRKTRWNPVYHKNWWFFWVSPTLNANLVLFFEGFFSQSRPVYDQTQGFGVVFSLLYG
jgi:hypothetical protein